MSYVIHLWTDTYLPGSLADAQAQLEPLRRLRRRVPEPRFHALVERISAAYGEALDEERSLVWDEMPEVGDTSLLTLGLNLGDLTKSYPMIQLAARELGLVIYDGQAGEVWLPDGTGYNVRGAFQAEIETPDETEALDFCASNVVEVIRTAIGPTLEAHGFRRASGEAWFEKDTPAFIAHLYGSNYWDRVTFWMHFECKPVAGRPELNKVCEDWSLVIDLEAIARRQHLPFSAVYYEPAYELRPVETWPQAHAAAEELRQLFASPGCAFLGTLNTAQDLDHWVNRVADEDCFFPKQRNRTVANGLLHLSTHGSLLVAWLAENENFETMARARLEDCQNGDEITRAVALRVAKFMNDVGLAT